MTMPHERTRVAIHTRDFLVELSRSVELPEDVRSSAKHLLRHYPNATEVFWQGKAKSSSQALFAGRMYSVPPPSIYFRGDYCQP